MQREALERTISALGLRLGPEHAATVEAARGLADAVDARSDRASLWEQYRAAVSDVLMVGAEVDSDAGDADFLSIVRPAVGDS